MDYAKKLFSKEGNSHDYAADLFRGPKKVEELANTNEISAITGKPKQVYQATGQKSAGFGTQWTAGLVNDPETKKRIYAAARFPTLSEEERLEKYEIDDKTGEIYFRVGNELHRETHNSFVSKLNRFAAQNIATPSTILGTAGAAFGGVPAIAGGVAGEVTRQALGSILYDEPSTPWSDIFDLTLEGGSALIGAKGLGKGISKLINKARLKKVGGLTKMAGEGSQHIDYKMAKEISGKGDRFGIHLFPQQTTKSRELTGGFELLRDSAPSGNIIQKGIQQQQKEIDNAVYKYFNSIAEESDPLIVGEKLQKTSVKALKRLSDVRKAKASPLYDIALKEDNPSVDIQDIIKTIDEEIGVSKGKFLPAMEDLKKTFLRKDLPKKTLVDKAGNPLTEPLITYETKLNGLHHVKLALDEEIRNLQKKGKKGIALKYQGVRDELLEKMDDASPIYKRARKIYSELSPSVTRAEKGIVGDLSRKSKEKTMQNNVRDLFNNRSPAMVKRARVLIQKESPEAWRMAVRTHLQDTFEQVTKGTAEETGTIGLVFQKRVFGNERQRKVLKEALTEKQYNTLSDFMQVLRRSGIGTGKQSMTEPRQEIRKELKEKLGHKVVKAWAYPLVTYRKIVADHWSDLSYKKGMRKLAAAMVSEQAHADLKKIKLLSPSTQRFMESFGAFLALVGNDHYKGENNVERINQQP